MKIKLFLCLAVLFLNQNVFGDDLVGEWAQPVLVSYHRFQFKLGGEDFGQMKIDLPAFTAEPEPDRTVEFKKDGTGTYKDRIRFSGQEKFTFTWIVTGNDDSVERNIFIAFDQPLGNVKHPLVVFSVKQSSQDKVVLSSIKQNSSLGDGINGINFERSKSAAPGQGNKRVNER